MQGIEEKQFPARALKSEVAAALKMADSTFQELLNRKYIEKLREFGYHTTDKFLSRRILLFLHIELALLPEDFTDQQKAK